MDSKIAVSIAICTYNRSSFLKYCIDSIIEHVPSDIIPLDIYIIDNNSNDNTRSMIESMQNFSSNKIFIHYTFLSDMGLAKARNKAIELIDSDWIFFLDDDAKILSTTLPQILFTISNYNFKIFSGGYIPYYVKPIPKWLSKDFGAKIINAQYISSLDKDYISGGLMIIHKSIFPIIGTFKDDFGMKGKKIGYAEETEFVIRALQKGISVGINPNLQMEHLVGPWKYKLSYHLIASFSLGRDSFNANPSRYINFRKFIYLPFTILSKLLQLRKQNYYIQNVLIDGLHEFLFETGMLYSKTRLLLWK